MVVCKKYKLAKFGKAYTKDHRDLVRSRMVVTRSYFEQYEPEWESSGILYVLDEEATKKYYSDCKKINKARKEAALIENAVSKSLVNALKGVTTESIQEAVIIPEKEEEEIIEDDKYNDDSKGAEAPNMDWGKAKLVRWIEENGPEGFEFDKSANKADLMEGPINEILTPKS